jgi:23S rRNA pseudouridine2605 synthase
VSAKRDRRIGLARALSKLGYCSRSRATELIREGRVRLNAKVCLNPEARVLESDDEIAVDGLPVRPAEKIYLMMNKPRGVVTTAADEKGRETVYSLLPAEFSSPNQDSSNRVWLAPVGRLDKASEGLLLLTNDSEWAACIAAPETHLEKTYNVQIAALADDVFVQGMMQGVRAKNGELLSAKQARVLRVGEKNCWLEIVLDEGKNRQIRRMVEGLGVEVLRLVRVGIGGLRVGDLPKGKSRALSKDEKRMLNREMAQGR